MDVMISSLLKFQIQVLSLGTDLASCKSECKNLDGHLPFLFEGWDQKIHLSWWHKMKDLMLVTYQQLLPTEVEVKFLTVELILDTSVPKGSKMAITAEMNVKVQK